MTDKIKIKVFDDYPLSNRKYGGHGGRKKGVVINGENWFIKYPKETKNMRNVNVFTTLSPLSEFLASHIYESIGIPTHKTILGISNKKVVVLCRDFLSDDEFFYDYNEIRNDYEEDVEKALDELSLSCDMSLENNIEEVITIMNTSSTFITLKCLKERFWDMFIVDSFVCNNDRNEGNWGIIYNSETKENRVAPVFDNGASFYNKHDDEKMNALLKDDKKLVSVFIDSCNSIFKENGKSINPLKYIESMKNDDCNNALIRLFPKINLNEINKMIDDVPEFYEQIEIFSETRKKFYKKSLEYRYNFLKKVYDSLVK